jgi:hypothetical protein
LDLLCLFLSHSLVDQQKIVAMVASLIAGVLGIIILKPRHRKPPCNKLVPEFDSYVKSRNNGKEKRSGIKIQEKTDFNQLPAHKCCSPL